MAVRIEPISGFPEFTPAQQLVVNQIVGLIRKTYESFGYTSIETPAVERLSHLMAKGIEGKEVYVLRRAQSAAEDSDTALALHFDLTVPLARYVAQHYSELTFPFRRYQIQPVWRGERPQKGRYRQFYQCDIDVIGDGNLPLTYDAEIPAVIFTLFSEMGIGDFTIKINNRKILVGLFSSLGLETEDHVRAAMRVIDDIEKKTTDETVRRLRELNVTQADIERLLLTFRTDSKSNQDVISLLRSLSVNDTFSSGVEELAEVVERSPLHVPDKYDPIADALGEAVGRIPTVISANPRTRYQASFEIDLSIARGLDYYTGTVYETRLNDHPKLGSICSGGRYDNLAGAFVDRALPGVGISIGLSRLLSQLFEAKILNATRATPSRVLVAVQDKAFFAECLSIGHRLRSACIATEVFLSDGALSRQMRYANQKGIDIVVFCNKDELERQMVRVRHMLSGEEKEVSLGQLVPFISMQLS